MKNKLGKVFILLLLLFFTFSNYFVLARRGFVMSSDLANNLSPSQNSLAASAQVALAFNDFDSTSEPSIHSIDDEVEVDNDVEPLPTSPSKALSTLDDGTNIIFKHPNSNLDNLSLPQNATHVMIGETLTPDLCPTFLRSLINLNFDTLLVLDIPNCGLTSLPLDLSQLIKLEELNVSNNPFSFYTLPSVISTLHLNLRLLKADNCNLTSLPKELSKMASLNTLSLRNNRFPVLPAWLCLLSNLELLLVDDNPICDQWRPIISPILSQTIRDKSSNPSTPKLPQQNQNLNLPYHQHRSLTQDLDHLTLRSTTPESMRRMKSTTDITNYTPKAPDRLTSLNYSSNLNLNSNNNIINNNNLNNNYVNVQNNEDNSNPLKKNWGIFKKMSMNRLRSASNVALRQTYSSHSNNVTPNLNNINNKNNNVNNPNLNKHTSSNSSTISSNASKRRSFLPLNSTSMINNNNNNNNGLGITASPNNSPTSNDDNKSDWFNSLDSHDRREEEYSRGFKSVMSYLKDLYDLGVDADEELDYETDPSYLTLPLNRDSAKFSTSTTTTTNSQYLPSIPQSNINSMNRQLTNESSAISRNPSSETSAAWSNNGALSNRTTLSSINDDKSSNNDNKSNQQTNIPLIESKSDPKKQYHVIREIIETERTYVKGLQELVDIYVVPSVTEIPAAERKRVYLGVEGLLSFHRDSMLPSLENALYAKGDEIVIKVAQSFIRHAAFLKIYNIYINEFDYAQNRAKWWMEKEVNNSSLSPKFSTNSQTNSPSMQSLTVSSGPSGINIALPASKQPANYPILNSKEKKRIRQFCKAARKHPKHTQLNLESYLLLPIQRIPRYRMLVSS